MFCSILMKILFRLNNVIGLNSGLCWIFMKYFILFCSWCVIRMLLRCVCGVFLVVWCRSSWKLVCIVFVLFMLSSMLLIFDLCWMFVEVSFSIIGYLMFLVKVIVFLVLFSIVLVVDLILVCVSRCLVLVLLGVEVGNCSLLVGWCRCNGWVKVLLSCFMVWIVIIVWVGFLNSVKLVFL